MKNSCLFISNEKFWLLLADKKIFRVCNRSIIWNRGKNVENGWKFLVLKLQFLWIFWLHSHHQTLHQTHFMVINRSVKPIFPTESRLKLEGDKLRSIGTFDDIGKVYQEIDNQFFYIVAIWLRWNGPKSR